MTKCRTLAASLQYSPLEDGGAQASSFTAIAGRAYTFPVGGTVTLPSPTGSRRKIALEVYGAGASQLSGTVNGVSGFQIDGDQTLVLTDADVTRGWV